MLLEIDRIMRGLGIENYWIVNHNVKIFNLTYVEGVLDNDINEDIFNVIFFVYDKGVGKIEYDNVTYKTLKYMLEKYIKDREIYCGLDGMILAFDNLTKCTKDVFDDFTNITDVISEEVVTFVDENSDVIIEETYTRDKITLYYKQNSYVSYCKENSLNICVPSLGFKTICCNNIPYAGMLNDVIEEKTKFMSDNAPMLINNGVITLSRNVFSFMLQLLMQVLDGDKIAYGSSIITIDDFGKMIFKEGIIIKDLAPDVDGCFDAEGITIKDKIIVDKGILVDCLNNIKSAYILKCNPGNAHYDCFFKCNINKSTKIYFQYNDINSIRKCSDIYLISVIDTQVVIDGDTGLIRLNMIGKSSDNKIRNYYIQKTIFDIFNSIVDVSGEYQEVKGCIIPEVIIDLGE